MQHYLDLLDDELLETSINTIIRTHGLELGSCTMLDDVDQSIVSEGNSYKIPGL